MKISPLAIQSYQQISKQNQQQPAVDKKQAEVKTTENNKIEIPLNQAEQSQLAVKANSQTYAENLTAKEKEALELLFEKYRSSDRFGSAFNTNTDSNNVESHLGQVLDVKV